MSKILFLRLFFVAFAALFAGAAIADEPCFELKAECVEYIREAAEQGNAVAQLFLGKAYYKGYGVTMDKREAVRWLRLAAEQGVAKAQAVLGAMYFKGEGVVEDEREGYIWFLIAKASGAEGMGEALQKISWQELTPADRISAKREAKRRFKAIEKRREELN